MNVNPRANGFNYGTGWGPEPKPPVYLQAMVTVRRLNKMATDASRTAWALEMKLRNVRLAETAIEKMKAVAALDEEMHTHQRVLQAAE